MLHRLSYSIRRVSRCSMLAPLATRAVLTTNARGAGADASRVPVAAEPRGTGLLVVT